MGEGDRMRVETHAWAGAARAPEFGKLIKYEEHRLGRGVLTGQPLRHLQGSFFRVSFRRAVNRRSCMAKLGVPHFHNDIGVEKIHIGVKEFQCMGARPPMDHPHVYLDMGADDQIVCPYCSTLFIYDANLRPDQTDPPYCLFEPQEADAR